MNGVDRNKAAADEALRRLEEDAQRQQRRLLTAVERIQQGVVKILGGNRPPQHQTERGDR